MLDEKTEPDRRTVVRDSLAVGLAVGLSGLAFGATALAGGLSVAQACVLSVLAFTGASQFALVATIASGGNPVAGVVGATLLGSRNALYGLRLGPVLGFTGLRRWCAAHVVVDETAAITLAQPGRRSARLAFTTTGVTLFVLWCLTTYAGAAGAAMLGDPARFGLDAAGPAVFLAMLAPSLRQSRAARATAALAVSIALGATPWLPPGVPILTALLAAAVVLVPAGRRSRAWSSGS